MSDTINMLDAKSSLSKLVHALETGQASEFIIARNGRPAARLVPLLPAHDDRQRRIGAARGRFAAPADTDALNADVRRLLEGGT
ncbi:MAG: type II toxin-antitoxin system Phd/YefM family antitoxin [Rubrivivax sp.]|nr:type II toxin-antitoxin system Phd/YefM family antitoxin [Rubrivivax sp.]